MVEFIYIGSTELEKEHEYFKIGKTKQSIEKIIKQYQTGRSVINEFFLLDYFECEDCDSIEKVLKERLKDYKHVNEVYHIKYDFLKAIIEDTIKKEKEIKDNLQLSNFIDLDNRNAIEYNLEHIINKQNIKINKDSINIYDFIIKNNYLFILTPCFNILWNSLFCNKRFLITNEILDFIYKKSNLDYVNSKRYYKSILIKNNIEFEVIEYYKDILKDYKYLEDELKTYAMQQLVQKTWLKLSFDSFKESIMEMVFHKDNDIKRYITNLENLHFNYCLNIIN